MSTRKQHDDTEKSPAPWFTVVGHYTAIPYDSELKYSPVHGDPTAGELLSVWTYSVQGNDRSDAESKALCLARKDFDQYMLTIGEHNDEFSLRVTSEYYVTGEVDFVFLGRFEFSDNPTEAAQPTTENVTETGEFLMAGEDF